MEHLKLHLKFYGEQKIYRYLLTCSPGALSTFLGPYSKRVAWAGKEDGRVRCA